MSRKLFVASALMCVMGAFSILSAQQDDKAGSDKANVDRSAAKSDHKDHKDHMFASCIATGNQEEIILSEVGREKATNEEVKKFAEMMITDHHTFLIKLKKFAPEATKADYLASGASDHQASNAKDDAKEAKGKIRQTAATEDSAKNNVETADAKAHHEANYMAIERELALECLALSKEKLNGKLGAEFDQCFMGLQLSMHMGMKAKLTVLQRHASGELAGILAEGLKKTDEHLAKAEEIMKDIAHHPTIVEKTKEGGKKEKTVIKQKD